MKAFPALAAILSVVAALLTACSTTPGRTAVSSVTQSSSASGTRAPVAHPSAIRVFGQIFDNPGVTVTGGRLYVTWQVNATTAAVPQFELTRVDQANGVIEASHLLTAGQAGTPLSAGGWLWVPVATSAGESLLRLNPASLAEAGDLAVRGSHLGLGRGSHLAAAGDALWVAAGARLLRVSLITGQVLASIPLPGPTSTLLGLVGCRVL